MLKYYKFQLDIKKDADLISFLADKPTSYIVKEALNLYKKQHELFQANMLTPITSAIIESSATIDTGTRTHDTPVKQTEEPVNTEITLGAMKRRTPPS
jgi:hypothetical protein